MAGNTGILVLSADFGGQRVRIDEQTRQLRIGKIITDSFNDNCY
jgi:hypothetical protein